MYHATGLSTFVAGLLLAGSLSAQDTARVLAPGRSARFTLTDGARAQGTVISIAPGAVRLAITDGDTVSLAQGDVKKVEIYQGIKTSVGSSALTGGLYGAAFGALLGAVTSGASDGTMVEYSAGTGALAYGAVFGVLGAGIGALVGTKHRPSWDAAIWPSVTMGPVASGAEGVTLALRYRF